ncbi:hypothetical protein [Pseudodesulfovibrio sediminis]|uniref:Uncharacterized protein n=1 Tax=Pseudodesulfovibrio sediminis TaxID=2810563 RepID=A0ABN6EQQ5_9BACT|nr:hypothetical protein [Pseudodesulfovibrio sediminis]BCS88748.1 hypothetical protein PSDVSF_19900 [Pseudodesulfovibrio sediminis]
MQQEHSPIKAASKMTAVPLGVAYVAVPLGALLVRYANLTPDMSPFPPWALLAALGTAFAMLFRRSGVRVKKRFIFELTMFLGLVTILTLYHHNIFQQLTDVSAALPEFTPLIMLGFGWLWTITFGTPNRRDFQRYGALLGVICMLDLAAEAYVYHAAPALRWVGNSDVLAGLLLVSLCASLKPDGTGEPDQGSPIWRWLILAGLASTLSHTGLFCAAWVFLCFGRGSLLPRTLVTLCFFALIGATFLLPITASESIRYMDYWLWAKSIALFANAPDILVTGLPLTSALPMSIPPELTRVWETATGSSAVMGIYLPHVQSFWLRLVLGWGAFISGALLVAFFVLLFKRITHMGAGLAMVLFTQGMSTPLLYDPTLGAILALAFMLALAPPVSSLNVRTARPSTAPAHTPEVDPTKEWNMRPL